MPKTNYLKRSLGVAFAALPALPLLSALMQPQQIDVRDTAFVVAPLVLAAAFAFPNFHLSFVRPWLYRRRHGSFVDYKFVSGIPMLGTLCASVAAYFGWGSILCGALILIITLIDTLSPPWFVIATWRDTSLWDA